MTLLENFFYTTIIATAIGAIFGLFRDKRFADYKADLERRDFEHRTRFSKLHERRAEIIAELYQRMVNTHRLIRYESFPIPTFVDEDGEEIKGEPIDRAFQAYIDFDYFFDENRIYFTKEQCTMLDGLSRLMSKGSMATRPRQKYITDPEVIEFVNTQLKEALTEIPQVLESLEDTFRKLLGIELDEKKDLTPSE